MNFPFELHYTQGFRRLNLLKQIYSNNFYQELNVIINIIIKDLKTIYVNYLLKFILQCFIS